MFENLKPAIFVPLVLLVGGAASAQQAGGEELERNIELMRENVRYEKSKWIRANVPMTESQAEVFWPLYRRYEQELAKIGEERVALIRDYAEHHEKLSDQKARAILDQSFTLDSKVHTIQRLYKNEFLAALPPKVVARFFQVEHRLNLLIDLQAAAQIPLVE